MRAGKVLALLAEQERKFDRERAVWRDERERLLDRLMTMADKPMPEAFVPRKTVEQDVFDPDRELGADLYLPSDLPGMGFGDGPEGELMEIPAGVATMSPRERMLREES